jgi:2-phosphosulfolactate phosphatase
MQIKIRWFPEGAKRSVAEGDVCLVVDTLRCTSFMTTAFELGAREIVPVSKLPTAFMIRDSSIFDNERGKPLIAGEVHSEKVEGFDFGNSPTELLRNRDRIGGRNVVMRTSAGTQVLWAIRSTSFSSNEDFLLEQLRDRKEREREEPLALIACLLNAKDVSQEAARLALLALDRERAISICCSGFEGRNFALEDFLCAGAICSYLEEKEKLDLSDEAKAAKIIFETLRENTLRGNTSRGNLSRVLRETESGRKLIELGEVGDIDFCSRVSIYKKAPRYNGMTVFV